MKDIAEKIRAMYKIEDVELAFPYTGHFKNEYAAECYSRESDIHPLTELTNDLNVSLRKTESCEWRHCNQILFKTENDFIIFQRRVSEKFENTLGWKKQHPFSEPSTTISGLSGLRGMFAKSAVISDSRSALEEVLKVYQTKKETKLPTLASAFRRATHCGNRAHVELFINQGGFDLEEPTSKGFSALDLAKQGNYQEIAEIISAAIDKQKSAKLKPPF